METIEYHNGQGILVPIRGHLVPMRFVAYYENRLRVFVETRDGYDLQTVPTSSVSVDPAVAGVLV